MREHLLGYNSGVTLPAKTTSIGLMQETADLDLVDIDNSGYFKDTDVNHSHSQAHSGVLKIVHFQDFPDVKKNVQLLKRFFDIVFSVCVMITGIPIIILLYLVTKFSSAGPAIFKQERIGKNGRPFRIYKFRSMYVGAEKSGPQLSKGFDPRITRWGSIMRKTRLDELPQFWNVLKGDMSVVGPRPERQHYIDQIVVRDPHYMLLQRIKPGITSIGQVEFGYAENLDEMCKRLQYDLIYLKKVSLLTDISIILRTVVVMIKKSGK
jgi:putative colanic acid biosynthesis UDP-glucose lipid carrier transferase